MTLADSAPFPKDSVDRLSDLLSDIFSADDSHILDTSTSALGTSAPNPVLRSPSRTASVNSASFFRTTAVTPTDSSPLLSTATLQKLNKYVQGVAAKNKGEEMLEEVEEGGLAKLLKLLARSWDGIVDQSYWIGDAAKARDEEDFQSNGHGKGKGKSRGKGKGVSPAKKGGKKKKTTSAVESEEEDEEDDSGRRSRLEAGTANGNGNRRSSRSSSRSRSPTVQQDLEGDEEPTRPDELSTESWTTDAINSTHRSLRNLSDALLAIRTALSILTLSSVSLPKHLFSSDYLESLLAVLRHTLDSFFNPLLESPTTSLLSDLFDPAYSETRDKISELCDSLSTATDSFSVLVKEEDMGDDLINAAVFFALDPFFHEAATPLPPVGKRKSAGPTIAHPKTSQMQHALKSMRMTSLHLVRRVYAKYADQRSSIVEEVLGNLGRGDGAGPKKGRGEIRSARLRRPT